MDKVLRIFLFSHPIYTYESSQIRLERCRTRLVDNAFSQSGIKSPQNHSFERYFVLLSFNDNHLEKKTLLTEYAWVYIGTSTLSQEFDWPRTVVKQAVICDCQLCSLDLFSFFLFSEPFWFCYELFIGFKKLRKPKELMQQCIPSNILGLLISALDIFFCSVVLFFLIRDEFKLIFNPSTWGQK